MEGQPLAREGDLLVCPCPVPCSHVVGRVVGRPGAASEPLRVMSEGHAVATNGDPTQCGLGFPGTVTARPGGVFVGGKAVATRYDLNDHFGMIVGGAERTRIGSVLPEYISVIQRGKVTILVDRRACTITLVGVMEYAGDGATQRYVDDAVGDINRVWATTVNFEGARYTVVPRIQGRLRAEGAFCDPGATAIDVEHALRSPEELASHIATAPHQWAYGRWPGRQYDNSTYRGHTPAHEFGHAIGLRDTYEEEEPEPDGRRNAPCRRPPGELMCDDWADDARPTDEDIAHLVTGDGLL